MKQRNTKRIILTGGHAATAALSMIERLDADHDWDIVWIGTKRAMEGSDAITLEFKLFPEKNVRCISIPAGRLQRKFSKYSLISIARIPIGFIASFIILFQLKPDIILSFGGFAAYPVVVMAKLLGIPVIIHEQTASLGRANKASLPFAKGVAISRESSKTLINHKNVRLTGNPVSSVFTSKNLSKKIINNNVFVTGGSRGSKIINDVVSESLSTLSSRYTIVHQTGEYDFARFQKKMNDYKNYKAVSTITPEEMALYMMQSEIVVSRAGANTVSELLVMKKPAILVPIPWSSGDEQTKNAELVVESGRGIIIPQDKLTKKSLIAAIDDINSRTDSLKKLPESKYAKLDRDASHELLKFVKENLM